MPLKWETVAIPFAQGVQPSTRARLLEPTKLLEAQNCSYVFDQGPQKRFGHTGRAVATNGTPSGTDTVLPSAVASRATFSTDNPNLPSQWLHGWGLVNKFDEPGTGSYPVSTDPRAGLLFGQFQRDSEVVSWDGHRLFSYASRQFSRFGQPQSSPTETRGPAVMPAMRAEPIAKTANGQVTPDVADNGVVRTAVWIDSADTSTNVSWVTYDSVTSAVLNSQTEVMQTPVTTRAICVGPWTHLLVADTAVGEVLMRSFHQDTPATIVSRSIGASAGAFDVKKVNESVFVLMRVFTLGVSIRATVLGSDGSTITNFTPDIVSGDVANVAFAVDKNQNLGVLWNTVLGFNSAVRFRTFNLGGGPMSSRLDITTTNAAYRITISSEYTGDAAGSMSYWCAFVEDIVSANTQTRCYRLDSSPAATLLATRHNLLLGSHAFTVGERAYLWTSVQLSLQSTWFLCDRDLLPIGKLDFGLADTANPFNTLPSVNWVTTDTAHSVKDLMVFHGCLPYRQRVISSQSGTQPNGVFAEPSIRFYQLDFLPRLRAAQAGRSTYLAGAQLWTYDGAGLTEAGFHLAPEGTLFTPDSHGGDMSSDGDYQYRIDLCHKNAQNEEVRSWSIISTVTMGASDTEVVLTIPHMPATRREDAYFLIFRTELNLGSFYLVSSRNPADSGLTANGFVRNARADATYTFTDQLADTAIISREYHPGNVGGNYLEPLPAPACELVAAGRDRVWLAGGELAPGEVAPSRLFPVGTCPAFSPALNIQVDRGAEPVTAIGFAGDLAVFFRRTSIYVMESDGPDNVLVGQFFPPRLALSDVGAVSQDGVVLASPGLFFQSPAGIRLLAPSGSLNQGIGQDVDALSIEGDYAAAVLVAGQNHIRWYSRDPAKPTLVLNYVDNIWTTWTGVDCVGACYWAVGDAAILSRGDARVWLETPDYYLDEDRTFEMLVRVSWLRAGSLGDFQSVRRILLMGNAYPDLSLRIRYFYDERPFHSEETVVEFPGSSPGSQFNNSTWGSATSGWGTGPWGDADNVNGQPGLYFRDGVFRLRKRPSRIKCSVFSVEFSDQGGDGAGFVPVALALELGRFENVDRVPGAAAAAGV